MKKSFIKKRFHKLLLENEQHRVVCNEEIFTAAILIPAELSKLIQIQDEAERILDIGNIRTYRFRPYSKNQVRSYKFYSEKDFNWKGEPKKGAFKDFVEEPFDLLIGYFNKNNLYLENAVLRSKAKFKVGFAKVNQGLYDLEIAESTNNVESFLSELKKYLLVLQKLKN